MRVGVYIRVSTQRQAEAQTIEQQLGRLLPRAEEQGWTIEPENIFRDDGYSGATLKRPGLERLRDRAAVRHLDRLLVTAPDRLARNYVHQVLLLEEIEATGCQVQFLDRPMSQDPHDQLLLQIRGAVAEYERTLIAERMRRGRLAKLKAGLLLPWTRAPYGYRLDPERPRDPAGVRVDEAEAAAVREMFTWYAEEESSLYRLAKKLQDDGVPAPRGHWRWNVATLRGILSNPCYTGTVWAGRVWRRGLSAKDRAPAGSETKSHLELPREDWVAVAPIPALVSQELFERVEAKLARNRQFASRNNTAHPYLVRNLVRCGLCGLSCQGTRRKGYAYYICRGKAHPIQSCRDEKCPARFAPAGALDELVWADLCALLSEPAQITGAMERAHGGHWLPQELEARRQGLRRGVASLDQQLERLTEAYLASVLGLEEYRRRRADLEQRRAALDGQLRQLEAQAERRLELAGLAASAKAFCERVQASLESASFEEKRRLVELLVDTVVVADGEVEIRYVVPLTAGAEQDRFCRLHSVHLHLPASDEEADDPARLQGGIGREQRLRLLLAFGISDQYPAQRHDRLAFMVPHGRTRRDIDFRPVSRIPGHLGARPHGRRVLDPLGKRGLALPLLARTSPLPRRARRCGIVEGGVETKTGDHRDRSLEPAAAGQQMQSGVGLVGHRDDVARGQPAPQQHESLAPPRAHALVPKSVLGVVALGGRKERQERQRPHALDPGDPCQEHDADPAQPLRLDEKRPAATDRIAVDALGADLRASAALERLVDADDHRLVFGDEGGDEHAQEQAREGQGRPGGTAQHAMIGLEIALACEPHHSEHGGYGASAAGQNGAEQEDAGVLPRAAAEIRGKARKDPLDGGRYGGHGSLLLGRWTRVLVQPACHPSSSRTATSKWIKSS